jgi:hypothetical protein
MSRMTRRPVLEHLASGADPDDFCLDLNLKLLKYCVHYVLNVDS